MLDQLSMCEKMRFVAALPVVLCRKESEEEEVVSRRDVVQVAEVEVKEVGRHSTPFKRISKSLIEEGKFVPVNVMASPPIEEPDEGEIEDIVGVCVELYVILFGNVKDFDDTSSLTSQS